MSHAGSAFNVRGGDLHLLVGQGQTYFKIHSHFFIRESEWWKKQLLGPEPTADAPLITGTSRANAYALREESTEDFRQLLSVFYNNSYGDYSHFNVTQWLIILCYAHKWAFREVGALAIRYLDNHHMDIVDRIVLYQRNHIPKKYLLPCYIQLASRPESLGLEECRSLGYMNYWFLNHARDALYAKLLSSRSTGNLSDLDEKDVTNIVRTAYARTINDMDPTPDTN